MFVVAIGVMLKNDAWSDSDVGWSRIFSHSNSAIRSRATAGFAPSQNRAVLVSV